MLVLLVMVALTAWLLYASIDPDEASAGSPLPGQAETPQR
jgi:hypothetical protein